MKSIDKLKKQKNYVTAKQKDLNMEIWENTLILLMKMEKKQKQQSMRTS